MEDSYDIAVVGSGFGGTLLSMIARKLGYSVTLLERGRHPRFAIGESTSPLANILLEQLARRYDLPRLLPLTTCGTWKQAYPDVAYGLKRGFSFFHHTAHKPYRTEPDHGNQLLVAASPNDRVSDMHWFRSDVDHFFVKEAVALGVEYRDQVNLTALERDRSGGFHLSGTRLQESVGARARFVVDATGPRGFLSKVFQIPAAAFDAYPNTQALFSHFRGVQRCDATEAFQEREAPPYPIDDAAVHHVFDGGWMWVLRFNNGITSAGVAVMDWLAKEVGLSEGAPAWDRLLARFPTLAELFASSEPVRPFVYAPRLSYRTSQAAGEGWAMLPSAAAFVDPLFSTGIPLTLIGIERLAKILEAGIGPSAGSRLQEYAALTLADADWTARYFAAAYASMHDFDAFADFSMFYFAAASFAEMARRLDRCDLAARFMAADHAGFSAGLESSARALIQHDNGAGGASAFRNRVEEAIAPLNIAGLMVREKRNWYGIDMGDVIAGAGKLGFTQTEMRQIIATADWL